MKTKALLPITILICIFPLWSSAQVTRSQLTSGIEQREPVDAIQGDIVVKQGEVKTLYLFSHISNLAGRQITHRWFYKDREMATVTLQIGSNNWRTYSSKRIMPHWQGQWKVQIWHEDLQLSEHTFNIVDL